MRIGTVQFVTRVGDFDKSSSRADMILEQARAKNLELLVLPKLAFSGCKFQSSQQLNGSVEHKGSGSTSLWARTTALKHHCVVVVGYAEAVKNTEEYFNSALIVNPDGETIANYRKINRNADETWASDGSDWFFHHAMTGPHNVALGIGEDLDLQESDKPYMAWEFAFHVLHRRANLVIISMAWPTEQNLSAYNRDSNLHDLYILSHWIKLLMPLIWAKGKEEIIVVLANRCGTEDEITYAGTSCVLGIEKGEVKVYGILGRGQEALLVVDTTASPEFKAVGGLNASIPDITAETISDQETGQGERWRTIIRALLDDRTAVSFVDPRYRHPFTTSPPIDEPISTKCRNPDHTDTPEDM